jgi:type IV pilus assembly protein PilQ
MSMLTRMIKNNWKPLLAILGLLAAGLAPAQSTRTLQGVEFVALEGNRVQITLSLSEAAPEPVVFTIDKPARLSLDLPDTHIGLAERFKRINVGTARSVASAEAKGRTRVVVELSELTPYTVRTDGNKVLLTIENAGVTAGQSASVGGAGSGAASSAIRNIDFRRGEKGEGRVVVKLSDPRAVVDMREEGGKIVASFKNTALPDNLLKRLDVLDFATPVKFIDSRRSGINAELTITPITGIDFEQVAYQTGDVFTVELQPLTQEKAEERRKAQPQWTGERISLSFQSVDIRALLQIIADVAGTNMVVSDSVKGDIAMRLQNVPWDQALDIIMRTKGLGMRQQGNVMLVAPLTELADRERTELETEKQKKELAPLRSELIQVNYAKATEVAALLKSGENSILTERGRLSVDERTNQLIVLETRETIAEIRALIEKLDIPVRQVLIESRIVIANEDFARDLGARFGVTGVGTVGNNGLFTTSGSVAGQDGTGSGTGSMIDDFLDHGFPVGLPSPNDRFNVNLPAAAANAGRIAFAILGADYLVDLELSALQTEGRGEVISTPRVITANGKQASIEQGREIPYEQAASSGATTIQFKKAVLSLTVTPQITPDSRVVMDLAVTNDSQGTNVSTGSGQAPAIDTRRLTTQVLIKSGETVVLGGVFQQESTATAAKVPLLGDIPLIGFLFRSDTRSTVKRELLIFVTPKVLREGLKLE